MEKLNRKKTMRPNWRTLIHERKFTVVPAKTSAVPFTTVVPEPADVLAEGLRAWNLLFAPRFALLLRGVHNNLIVDPDYRDRLLGAPPAGVTYGAHGIWFWSRKAEVPLEILNNPGRLDGAAWEQMKAHAELGAWRLADTPDAPPLAAVVAFEHHLRRDGRGYPAGVQRAAINLGGQRNG